MKDLNEVLLNPNLGMLSRRRVLLAAGLMPAIMGSAFAGDFWSQPRQLWLQRKTSKGIEEHRAVYFADGKIVWPEYARLCRLMRDVQAGQAVQMSPVLLDILCGMQAMARLLGHDAPLLTTSGYRSLKTNSATEGAVRNSTHTQGRAWDGRMPGFSASHLANIAKYLQGGGVGLYIDRKFIHVDDGRLRSWTGR